MMNKNLLFFNNNLSGMILFRKEIMVYFLEKGFEVYVLSPEDEKEEMIRRLPLGVKYIPINMDRTSTNPFKDVILFFRVLRTLTEVRPRVLFNYTIKPNVYGSLSACILGIKSIDMIAGLGISFTNNSISSVVARGLYRIAGLCATKMTVLNQSNYNTILSARICKESKLLLLKGGEGVDLKRYPFYPNNDLVTKFVFIGRLIEEKGYYEFVEAAKIIRQKHVNVEFHVVGDYDLSYPHCIRKVQVEKDVHDGAISYHGNVDDMSRIYNQTGVVIVIPSYYSEGLNRSLMEGCASGKPIITSDWPGCREMVEENENGFLVKPKDIESLVHGLEKYLSLSVAEREQYSLASRKRAEKLFNIDDVVDYYNRQVFGIVGGAISNVAKLVEVRDKNNRRAAA